MIRGQAGDGREPAGDVLEADGGDAGEEAGAALGDSEVGDVADIAVEDGRGGGLAFALRWRARHLAERADHAEGREVDADRLQARVLQWLQRGGDHVPAGGDDDHVDLGCGALDRADSADHTVVDHRLVQRHRDLLLGGEADRGGELVRVLDRRQPQRSHDHALVGDAEADALAELVLGEEVAQRGGDAAGVGDLAVVERLRGERRGGRRRQLQPPVAAHLGSADAAGLDLEADQGGFLRSALLKRGDLHERGEDAVPPGSCIGQMATEPLPSPTKK